MRPHRRAVLVCGNQEDCPAASDQRYCMSMSRAMDATQWLLVLHKCILRSILKSDSPCADQLTWLPCWCWRAVMPGFWSHGPIVCRSNHTLNRLLEVMADRLGEEHGGVTVTVHEGVPPTRLTRAAGAMPPSILLELREAVASMRASSAPCSCRLTPAVPAECSACGMPR